MTASSPKGDHASGIERAAPGEVRVRRALLSVSDKHGIVDFAQGLAELGVELVSTGGTARELAGAGVAVRAIEDFTGFPEMMDGRVKTLHARLYAGLLALRDDDAHLRAASEQEIEQVDLVCVNLYPFEQTVARGDASDAEVIENIDIGGPTMIRAAAKNSAFAAVVVDPGDYGRVLAELRESDGRLTLQTRKALAGKAFACTARYDAAISAWFAAREGDWEPLVALCQADAARLGELLELGPRMGMDAGRILRAVPAGTEVPRLKQRIEQLFEELRATEAACAGCSKIFRADTSSVVRSGHRMLRRGLKVRVRAGACALCVDRPLSDGALVLFHDGSAYHAACLAAQAQLLRGGDDDLPADWAGGAGSLVRGHCVVYSRRKPSSAASQSSSASV